MSKRLMLAVTVATMAALALPATSQAGGLRSDAGARKGCFLTHMMTCANKHLFRPVVGRRSHTKWRLFNRHHKRGLPSEAVLVPLEGGVAS
jgi:hypothetical protein